MPVLQGCFVDEPTIAQALTEIQPVAAMFLDLLREEGGQVPAGADFDEGFGLEARIPPAQLQVDH